MNPLANMKNKSLFSASLPVYLLGLALIGTPVMAQQPSDPGPDPADVNMAPVNGSQTNPQTNSQAGQYDPTQAINQAARQPAAPGQQPASSGRQNEAIQRAQEYSQTGQQAGAPDPNQAYPQQAADQQQPYDNGDDQVSPQEDAAYQELEADQAPPPLPTYDQPPAPEPNYMWTPGYWGYAPAGYYWVPGVWVASPWPGALWTPGYWAFYGGRYRFHHGYWGRYIGFYGGVPYGFGYTGFGYYGGYWRGNNFYYNRAVTRINTVHITNVYSHTVVVNNYNRVSYNGGPRGIQVQPRPQEIAARREPRLPPMNTQLQVRQQAQQNRSQFYNDNHGRPAMVAAPRPIAADAGVQRPVARPMPAGQGQFRYGGQPNQPNQATRPGQQQQPYNHSGQSQYQIQQSQPSQPQVRPAQPSQPAVQTMRPQTYPNQTYPNQQQQYHPQYQQQVRPIPQQGHPDYQPSQPYARPAQPTQQNQENHPHSQSMPQQQMKPVPEQQYRPQPQAMPQPMPQQQMRPVPEQQYHPQQQQQPRPQQQPQSHPSTQPQHSAPPPHSNYQQSGGDHGHGR